MLCSLLPVLFVVVAGGGGGGDDCNDVTVMMHCGGAHPSALARAWVRSARGMPATAVS
jgi:hypothetical protein